MSATLYDQDFYAWANEQAALLRAGNLAAVDIALIAEEIESLGRTEKRELISRLAVLLTHLLKWQHQPERRGKSWLSTIKVQRRDLVDNPSLKSQVTDALINAYGNAIITAAGELDTDEETFPASCPWSFGQIMDDSFWPAG